MALCDDKGTDVGGTTSLEFTVSSQSYAGLLGNLFLREVESQPVFQEPTSCHSNQFKH